MTDTILEEIKAAQAAPTDDYMAWAEIGAGNNGHEIILETVRLPQSIPIENIAAQVKSHAVKLLTDNGFSNDEVQMARLHITALPTAEEAKAELDAKLAQGDEMVSADLTFWETCRSRLHLKPQMVDGELEMDYEGMKIRRSAVS